MTPDYGRQLDHWKERAERAELREAQLLWEMTRKINEKEARAQAAEARLAEVEQERDDFEASQAALLARVAALEEALQYQVTYMTELAEMLKDTDGPLLGPLVAALLGIPDARAALAHEEEK